MIYDVACQWSVNFHRRVESYDSLFLPEEMDIVPAVGKFHLSAHKPACFPRFSLMFIPGAGHVDGEILETLWASFNKISPSARAMNLAHQQEVYDEHMRDSNWKKLVVLGKYQLEVSINAKLIFYSESTVQEAQSCCCRSRVHAGALQEAHCFSGSKQGNRMDSTGPKGRA